MTVGSTDVAVIGGGMVGAATALALVEAGIGVTVFETAFAGAGSSGAAMGHLVVMDDSPAQLALTAHSRRRWLDLTPTLGSTCEVERRGTVWVAEAEGDLAAAPARIRALHAIGVQAELLDAGQLAALEPALRPGLAGGLRVPDDAVLYPPATARALLERAMQGGARLHSEHRVAQLDGNGVVLADGTRVPAGEVVVAAGVASPTLIPGLPVVPRKGHLVITDQCPPLAHHQIVELGYLHSAHSFGGASVAFNVQPRRTGQLLIGSSRELVGFDGGIHRALVHRMLQRAMSFLPALGQARLLRTWTGFRPATPDKLPLIGRWPGIARTWVAAGHEGLGITMATGTADLIVAGITGSAPPVDPTPFRPDRTMPAMSEAA